MFANVAMGTSTERFLVRPAVGRCHHNICSQSCMVLTNLINTYVKGETHSLVGSVAYPSVALQAPLHPWVMTLLWALHPVFTVVWLASLIQSSLFTLQALDASTPGSPTRPIHPSEAKHEQHPHSNTVLRSWDAEMLQCLHRRENAGFGSFTSRVMLVMPL